MEQRLPETSGRSSIEEELPSLQGDDQQQISTSNSPTSDGLEQVDGFLELLSQPHSDPLQIPDVVELLFKSIESMISKYDDDSKFGHNEQRDSSLVAHLNRLSRLVKIIGEFTTCDQSDLASIFNRGSAIQHTAMCFLHTELRGLLNPTLKRYSTSSFTAPATPHSPASSLFSRHNNLQVLDHSSFSSSSSTSSSNQHQEAVEQSTVDDDDFPGYHPQDIYNMSKIAGSMISSGYQIECCLVYGSIRRTALNIKLERLGHVNISAEDINKMDWETLEGEIASMIDIIKRCSSSLFSAERNLCNAVFVNNPSIYRDVFTDLASTVMDRFFNFAQTITLTKCSAEKLFKFLDLYETLRDLGPEIENLSSSKSSASSSTSVKTEIYETVIQIGQAAVSMFCDLENSIKRDNSRTTVPSGAVHPLTRYTMNYLKYACEYKDALEQVFLHRQKTKGATSSSEQSTSDEKHADGANEDGTPKTSPFSVELNMVMDLLDENLETKSNLYRDHALRHIFMMNNGRYILQKIKSSPEIHDMMGATWCRRRSSDLRKYHKGYTRETWGRVLQCLRHEGLQVNGKMAKALLKERFKMFNNTIEEIHKTQSTWVVSDEQLQSEIRVSVSAVVIPAYRSFLGRFQQYLTHGRQTEKYIKYQPEDIENFIEGLFDGNPTAMARKRS